MKSVLISTKNNGCWLLFVDFDLDFNSKLLTPNSSSFHLLI